MFVQFNNTCWLIPLRIHSHGTEYILKILIDTKYLFNFSNNQKLPFDDSNFPLQMLRRKRETKRNVKLFKRQKEIDVRTHLTLYTSTWLSS